LSLVTLEFSRNILEKCSNIKFHENLSSGRRVVPRGRMQKHEAAQTRLKRICEGLNTVTATQCSRYMKFIHFRVSKRWQAIKSRSLTWQKLELTLLHERSPQLYKSLQAANNCFRAFKQRSMVLPQQMSATTLTCLWVWPGTHLDPSFRQGAQVHPHQLVLVNYDIKTLNVIASMS
jgi:hypothetical protein